MCTLSSTFIIFSNVLNGLIFTNTNLATVPYFCFIDSSVLQAVYFEHIRKSIWCIINSNNFMKREVDFEFLGPPIIFEKGKWIPLS